MKAAMTQRKKHLGFVAISPSDSGLAQKQNCNCTVGAASCRDSHLGARKSRRDAAPTRIFRRLALPEVAAGRDKCKASTNSAHHRRRESGLSLVELMIAMVVGLVLMAGVIEIFLGSKASYRLNEGLSEVQENGRFAMEFIRKDVRMAGYSGCANNVLNVLKHSSNDYAYDFTHGIQGFDARDTGWNPPLDTSLRKLTHPPIKHTDVLTVRTVLAGSTNTSEDMDDPRDKLHIYPLDPTPFHEGDIVMVSDCSGAAIFQITDDDDRKEIEHDNDDDDNEPENVTDSLGIAFGAGAQVQRVATISYFIASRDNSKNCEQSPCGLWQKVGGDHEQELVDGVDDMQVLYGVDSDSDNVPNRYVRADRVDQADAWAAVVSVRLALLVASDKNAATPLKAGQSPQSETLLDTTYTPAKDDLRLHHVFTDTIAIRNRAASFTTIRHHKHKDDDDDDDDD
jgi:type IV pilus assembly protein PilW